jgi:hypothetical protein
MSETQIPQLPQQLRRISLFDSYGLPWTARLSVGWILFVATVTGGMAAIPIGLYLGAWIRAKTRSALALLIYVLLTGTCAVLFPLDPKINPQLTDAASFALAALWFAGAVIARHQIARYYTQREGSEFRLSLAFTLLFGVWYLNYRIRPESSQHQVGPSV